ncbi:MAG: iron-containing alcohol dehydrogenase [Deltaproteobacteria bacterium]|nr:iron-containing alcohol dehydrogenase [Deltaproteobacteria bacterium]
MPYFLSPRVIFGKGAMKRLASELEGKGDKAVVITDQILKDKCGDLVEALSTVGYDVKIWDGVEADPTLDVALRASRFLLDINPQWVIGFGGGSAIDTAKAAWVLYERPDLADGDLTKSILPRAVLNLRRKARLAAVPTTSGTGADVTWVAVLTDRAMNRKIVFAHNDIVPDLSVLETSLTLELPKGLTASTGLDVIAHAIDGYTSKQRSDFSDGPCLQAARMAMEWLPKVCHDGSNYEAREKMLNAATIAGLGFGNSNTGLSHALGHSAGAVFHMGHGRAIGIALSYSLDYISTKPPYEGVLDPLSRLADIARFVGIDDASPREAVDALIAKIRAIQKEIGEPASLKEAGITEDRMKAELDTLVQVAEKDPNMFTTPCECKGDALRELFERMWRG